MEEVHHIGSKRKTDWRKTSLFLFIAFGISWVVTGIMYLAGLKLGEGPSTIIIALFVMSGPAVSTLIVQKLIYKGSVSQYGWRWKGSRWKYVFMTAALAILFVLLTLFTIYLLGNKAGLDGYGKLDMSESGLQENLIAVVEANMPGEQGEMVADKMREKPVNIPPWVLLWVILAGGVIAAFSINLPFMFGEEFGWRGLLLYELQPQGVWKANLLTGFFWGLWHLPLILMGHNYAGEPVAGAGMMILFTTSASFLFTWSRLRSRNIIGPCVLHGMVNGTAGVMLFVHDGNSLFGSIAGMAGVISLSLLSMVVYGIDRNFVKNFRDLDPP